MGFTGGSFQFSDILARFANDAQVVVVGTAVVRFVQIDPDIGIDLLLLDMYLVAHGLRHEEYDAFADLTEGTVVGDLAERGDDRDIEPCFLLDLTDGGLFLGLALLYMTLGEAVVAAVVVADEQDLAAIREYVGEYCELFGGDAAEVMDSPFTVVTPDSRNPYKQLYVAN